MSHRAEEAILSFIHTCRLESLSERVVRMAKCALIDTLGVALAGTRTQCGKILIDHLEETALQGPCLLFGTGLRIDPLSAGFGNGQVANALDADDGHRGAQGHPGVVVVPAAFAAAETGNLTGKALLEMVVMGYEVGIRAGMALHRDPGESYRGTGNWGAIAAAASAIRGWGLEERHILNALGIADIASPRARVMGWVSRRQPPMVKNAAGWAVRAGIEAVMLARRGFTGTLSAFDDKEEFASIESLGRDFEILNIYFKPYACCRWTHAAVDGAVDLQREHGFKAADVAEITVHTFRNATLLSRPDPQDPTEAQFSLPHVLGCALVMGDAGPMEMLENPLKHPEVRAMAERVRLVLDPDAERLFPVSTNARVRVRLADGRSFETPLQPPRGSVERPMTSEDILNKFRRFAGIILGEERSGKLLEALWNIEKVPHAADLAALMTP